MAEKDEYGMILFDDVQHAIISEIGQAVERLGGNGELLAVICSWGDSMGDEDTLFALKAIRGDGTHIKEVICQIEEVAVVG